MNKLTIDDIKIKSRGRQLKERIQEKYGTVKNFAESTNEFGYATVRQYLNSSTLGSDVFKLFLIEEFGQGFNELILSEDKQIMAMVDEVFYNGHRYNNPEDIDLLEKLEELCIEKSHTLGQVKMKRNLAKHYFEGNRIKQAMMYIEEAIEKAEKYKFINYEIYFRCEYALMYYYQSDFKTAMKILKGIYIEEVKDDEFKDRVNFKYFYGYGVILNNIQKHEEARGYFEKALQHSYNSITKGVSISAIGLTYLRRHNYLEAILNFKKALEVQEVDHEKGIIYTNLAVTYRLINGLHDAMNYITKALELIDKDRSMDYFYAYKEYSRIKAIRDKEDEAINELFKLLKGYEDKFVPKSFIIEGFLTLIELANTYGHLDILNEVQKYLINIISIYEKDENYSKEYVERLYACIGKAYRYYIKS